MLNYREFNHEQWKRKKDFIQFLLHFLIPNMLLPSFFPRSRAPSQALSSFTPTSHCTAPSSPMAANFILQWKRLSPDSRLLYPTSPSVQHQRKCPTGSADLHGQERTFDSVQSHPKPPPTAPHTVSTDSAPRTTTSYPHLPLSP